ncbi:MAG TPA: glutaredoxin family protein [Planctomycetes bacterium]|nr:glutaredoxin family protein [Planctomycetota bacterium]
MNPFVRKRKRKVTVYSRSDCPLCDEALEFLARRRRRDRLEIEVKSIEGDPGLERAYWDRIPVILIDGKERFFGRIDPVLFSRLMAAPEKDLDSGLRHSDNETKS